MTTVVRLGRAALAAGAVAAMVACGSNNPNSTGSATNANPNATPPASTANDQAKVDRNAEPITITGCLQQGKRGTWIVTKVNEPSRRGVGTSGSAAAVEHEQLRAAENAYRVNPPDDVKLDRMDGKQVRVTGKVTDRGDLAKSANDATGTSGSSASANDRKKTSDKGLDISQNDLARIDASTVTATGAACGGGKAASRKAAPRHSARAKR